MKLLHTGDLHVTSGPRFDDTVKVLATIDDIVAAENIDLAIIDGDLTGQDAPHLAEPAERNAIADFLVRLAEKCRVLVNEGNHEMRHDLDIYAQLRSRYPIHVVTRPTRLELEPLVAYVLPYPQKRWLMASAAATTAIEGQKTQVEDIMRRLLVAWRVQGAEDRSAGRVPIGVMHLNVAGSVVGGDEVMTGREIELSRHDLDELGFAYIALSHIHRRQRMTATAWYAGSPSAQNHGEGADTKSVNVVSFDEHGQATVEQRPTGARRLVTVEMEWKDGDWQWQGDGPEGDDLKGAEVRVRAHVPEEALALADRSDVERILSNVFGAHHVRVERVPVPHVRSRLANLTTDDGRVASEAYQRAATLAEKLELYWATRGDDAPPLADRPRLLELLADLGEAA